MVIQRKSTLSGNWHMMEIPVTDEQLIRWENGERIQVAMPNLSADEREFIMTGITPDEWLATFGEMVDGEQP